MSLSHTHTLSPDQLLYFTPHQCGNRIATAHSTKGAAVETPRLLTSTLLALSHLSTQATHVFQSLDSDMHDLTSRMENLGQFIERAAKSDALQNENAQSPVFAARAQKRGEVSIELNPNSAWSAAYDAAESATPNLSALPIELRQVNRYSDAQAPIRHWIQEETLKKRREYAKWRKRKRERENQGRAAKQQPIMLRTVKKMELYHEKLREHRFGTHEVDAGVSPEDGVAMQHSTHVPSPLGAESQSKRNSYNSESMLDEDDLYVTDTQMHRGDNQSVTSINVFSPDGEEVQIGAVPHGVYQPPISPTSYAQGNLQTPTSPSAPPPPPSPLLKPEIKLNAPPFAGTANIPAPPPLPPLGAGVPAPPPLPPAGGGPPPPPPLNLNKLHATKAPSVASHSPIRSPGALSSPGSAHRKQASNLSSHSTLFDQIKAGNFNLKRSKTRSFDEAPMSPPSPQDNIMAQIRDFRKSNALRSVKERIAEEEKDRVVEAAPSVTSPSTFTTVADILRFSTINMADEDLSDETDDISDGDDLESW